jgi:hypothetical protein
VICLRDFHIQRSRVQVGRLQKRSACKSFHLVCQVRKTCPKNRSDTSHEDRVPSRASWGVPIRFLRTAQEGHVVDRRVLIRDVYPIMKFPRTSAGDGQRFSDGFVGKIFIFLHTAEVSGAEARHCGNSCCSVTTLALSTSSVTYRMAVPNACRICVVPTTAT